VYAVSCDKEEEEDDLKAGERGIGCDNERWRRPRCENGCKEVAEKG
jgi:hypothetical protein